MYFIFSTNTSWVNVNVDSMPVRIYKTKNEAVVSLKDSSEFVLSMEEATSLASQSQLIADEMSALMMRLYKTQVL